MWGAARGWSYNALSGCKCGAVYTVSGRTTDDVASSCCLALAHLQASAPQKAGIVRIPRPDRCVVGDRIPETPEQTPPYLVFPLELAAEGRLATDYSALDDRGLDDRRLHDHRLHDRRLHDCGLRDVGLLAVLLHLDGAAGGLGRGVGDRLLLDSRLWPPVILIDRVDAGGDGAADAAERQDDEEKNDQNYPAAMVRAARLVVAPAVVADSPGFAPAGIDQ